MASSAPSIEQLRQRAAELRLTLANLTSKKKKVDAHIKALHDYNEIKDVTQMLLGKLAELENVRTKDVYPRFDLQLDD